MEKEDDVWPHAVQRTDEVGNETAQGYTRNVHFTFIAGGGPRFEVGRMSAAPQGLEMQ